MKSLYMLLIAILTIPVVHGDDISFYGLKLSTGPRLSGVTRVTVSNFPWLTTKQVQMQGDLDRLIMRTAKRADGSFRPVKPAIFYLSNQKARSDTTTIAQLDHFYFFQKDVKDRLDQFRWYWAYVNSTAGRLLVKTYDLKEKTALLIFEADGSVLHIEAPITGPKSIARALRMIADKRRMEAAVKSDLPFLRKEYGAGNYKSVVKYLLRGEKYQIYATPWTKQKLYDMKRAVNHRGEEQIKRAEELASSGQRQDALKILAAVKRAFHPLSPATHALEVAKRIRRQRS